MVTMKIKESESVTERISTRLKKLKDAENRIAHYSQIQEQNPSLLNEADLAIAKADKANLMAELTFLERERTLLYTKKSMSETPVGPQPGDDN